MKRFTRRILIFLSKRKHDAYEFLKQNGFFDEIVRGAVKLIFYIIVFYYFGQAIW